MYASGDVPLDCSYPTIETNYSASYNFTYKMLYASRKSHCLTIKHLEGSIALIVISKYNSMRTCDGKNVHLPVCVN